MNESALSPLQRGLVGRAAHIWLSRPNLTAAIGVGLGFWLALQLWPGPLRWSTRSILAWDGGSLWFIVTMLRHIRDRSVDHIAAAAKRQDEGQGLILALVLVTCVASLSSVAAELTLAKTDHGLAQGARVSLAALTVAASWFMMQLIFALHYAHQYYSAADSSGVKPFAGGLAFPGEGDPDYWDFLHFAVVLGAAAQTADIAFTSKVMRRTGTMHSLIAFTFNTVVLALAINLLASLV